jgi:anaerobic dimethyl sulfoxide reductase subunit C (anchor subunit)
MIQEMNRSEEYGTLAAFTALAPLAVGGLIGLLVAQGAGLEREIDWAAMVILATGLLALVASLFHLGRPWRAPLAILRIATSWLSREVILFGMFLFILGCYAIFPILNLGSVARYIIGFAGAVIGLVGTFATGETYRLRARPSWDQWEAVASFPLGALSAGSLFGFFVARQFSGHSEVAGYAWIGAAVLLVLTLVLTFLRSTRRLAGSPEGQLSRQLALGPYLWLLVVRVAAVAAALVFIGMGGGSQFLAWIPALLGDFADRILFFKTVVPVTLRGRYT